MYGCDAVLGKTAPPPCPGCPPGETGFPYIDARCWTPNACPDKLVMLIPLGILGADGPAIEYTVALGLGGSLLECRAARRDEDVVIDVID